MKRCISGILAMLLCLCFAQIPKTASASVYVTDKIALARLHADEYMEGYSDTAEGALRDEVMADLIAGMACGLIDQGFATARLEEIGVYSLSSESTADTTATRSGVSDITLNTPTVSFDSYNNRWIISCGGYWNSDLAWQIETPLGTPYVGGTDAIGVGIYNTSGTYNTYIVSSYAYFSDGETESYVYSPRISSGTQGSLFEYEDYIHSVDSGRAYMGKHFAVVIIYDSNFANFHGTVRGTYVHTWSDAYISSVSFGSSGTYTITIQNSSSSFICQSSGEKRF